MVFGETSDDSDALGMDRILEGGDEERIPVLAPPFEVVQPVRDVGHHTVDVDHGEVTVTPLPRW